MNVNTAKLRVAHFGIVGFRAGGGNNCAMNAGGGSFVFKKGLCFTHRLGSRFCLSLRKALSCDSSPIHGNGRSE